MFSSKCQSQVIVAIGAHRARSRRSYVAGASLILGPLRTLELVYRSRARQPLGRMDGELQKYKNNYLLFETLIRFRLKGSAQT
jgi:hypothetical protein